MLAALARASGARASSLAAPRRFASAAYAKMKVKKNNWVEQNEVLRENQFHSFTMNGGNAVALLCLTVVFPGVMYTLMKDEFAIRERNQGIPVVERL